MRKRLLGCRSITLLILSVPVWPASLVHAEKRALLIGISDYLPPAGANFPVEAGHALDSRFAPGTTWNSLFAPQNDVASMRLLLHENYGFNYANITILPEGQATHDGILAAIDLLATQTQSGDLVVFYYSGHGSQRLDTLSSKNHRDQTIVPIDAWNRDEDVRDKELALHFDRIIYERHAHLTAILDSCDSATQARGITKVLTRALPYDDRDVAKERAAHPNTVVEADLKQIPQDGDAIFLAAAGVNESAVEARYPDDGLWHGAFTRALIHTLQSTSQTLSASDVVSAVSDHLKADHEAFRIDFQQTSLEGRRDQSLFGAPLPPHPLHVRVLAAPDLSSSSQLWKIDVGSAGGFEPGTQFSALDAGPDGRKSVLEVTQLDDPLVSTAKLVGGSADIKVGTPFELIKKVYPHASELAIFLSTPQPDAAAGSAKVQSLFPGLKWVADPSLQPIDYLVVHEDAGWVAYAYNGTVLHPGSSAKGAAYLVLGPPQSLIDQLKLYKPYQNGGITITHKLSDANYFLAMRVRPNAPPQLALFDPVVLGPRKPGDFVRSVYDDSVEANLNDGKKPEVVCRNDISMPVRTAWLQDKLGADTSNDLAFAITRRIVRIGKLRFLLSSAADAPTLDQWPYRLVITQVGTNNPLPRTPLTPGAKYDVRLLATADAIAAQPPSPKYLNLIGFDCAGDSQPLFPTDATAGTGPLPVPGIDGTFPTLKVIYSVPDPGVGGPFGADTIFLMATPDPQNAQVIISDGDLTQGADRGFTRGGLKDMNDFLAGLTKTGVQTSVKADWTLQEIVIPSRP